MKHSITVAGDIYSGLTHFALAGLSLIARSLTDGAVTTHWNNDPTPKGILEMEDVTPLELAEATVQISRNWHDGWATTQVQYGEGTFSPFSPRFKAINPTKFPEDWTRHQEARSKDLDQLQEQSDMLGLQFIQALGEAAYWRFNGKDPRPDNGASRWEMKTRNAGEEFVSQKLSKFVEELAAWDPERVLAGWQGDKIEDPFGADASRTPSGFTPPGETDLALAFAALVGIGQYPVVPRISHVTFTPGAYPDTAHHPQLAVLPVPTTPISPERFESIVLSSSWSGIVNAFGAQAEGKTEEGILPEQAIASLRAYGVPAAATFRIYVSPAKAPERYFERGRVQLL